MSPQNPTQKELDTLDRAERLSAAHVNGVIQVVRRVQIDELTKAIDSLKDSWSDLYPETK